MQMCWLAGDDPIKIKEFDKMPTLDYFIMLDKKISDGQKELARQKK